MAIKSSKYKKVLTKKLSSTVILLILLVMGVLAVIFNRFYINSSAKMVTDDGGTQKTSSNCCTKKERDNGSKCVMKKGKYVCVGKCDGLRGSALAKCEFEYKPKPTPVYKSFDSFPVCSLKNNSYIEPVTGNTINIPAGRVCTDIGSYYNVGRTACDGLDTSDIKNEAGVVVGSFYRLCHPTRCSNIGALGDCTAINPGDFELQHHSWIVSPSKVCNTDQDCFAISNGNVNTFCAGEENVNATWVVPGVYDAHRCYYRK